tara:strand:- start:204 stop:506 length:303 start_codon:yes stop_codon:yes gene_type:complete
MNKKKKIYIYMILSIALILGAITTSLFFEETCIELIICIGLTFIGMFSILKLDDSLEDLEKLTQEKMDKELDDIQNKDIEWDNEFEEPDYEWMAEIERGR